MYQVFNGDMFASIFHLFLKENPYEKSNNVNIVQHMAGGAGLAGRECLSNRTRSEAHGHTQYEMSYMLSVFVCISVDTMLCQVLRRLTAFQRAAYFKIAHCMHCSACVSGQDGGGLPLLSLLCTKCYWKRKSDIERIAHGRLAYLIPCMCLCV